MKNLIIVIAASVLAVPALALATKAIGVTTGGEATQANTYVDDSVDEIEKSWKTKRKEKRRKKRGTMTK